MEIKKLTTALLLTACTLACGCNPGNTSDSGSGSSLTGGVVNEPNTVEYVEGTLHDVNVDFDAPVSAFVTDKKTNYKVVSGGTKSARATGYISSQVSLATGATMEVIESTDISGVDLNTQYIFVGCEDLFVQLGGEVPSRDTIGPAGYQIQTVGKNVFINGYGEDAYQMGALCFLRQVVGYDMFAEDCIIYEKDGKVMPAMDIVERPDFDYRNQGGALSNTELYGMGFTYTPVFINPNYTGSFCHNWGEFVTDEDLVDNPDWGSNDATHYQGCWTARGKKESFKGLVNHITEKLKEFLKQSPTADNIMIAQHDITGTGPNVQNCRCASCQASYEYYGGTMAGAWLSLCNRAALQLDEWLVSQEAVDYFGYVKDVNVIQLVYHASVNPPAEKDAAGNYILDEEERGTPKEEKWFQLNEDGTVTTMDWDEAWNGADEASTETSQVVIDWTAEQERVYCAPSVQLMWATSAADWVHPYNSDYNLSWATMAKAWSGFEGDFYVWAYALNSQGIFYPYNSFDSMFESTRFFKGLNAKYIFWQGNYQNPKNGGFEKLKRYLESKVDFDVNSDYQYYVDKYFKYNYGAAGEYMQQYFEEVVLQCRYIEEENAIAGHIHNKKILYAENWPEGLMNSWIDLLDKAYEAIEVHKAEDPAMYTAYKNHITMESYFPRYVLVTTYADSYTASNLKTMRQSFLNDFYALGNNYYGEGKLITEITSLWDLD